MHQQSDKQHKAELGLLIKAALPVTGVQSYEEEPAFQVLVLEGTVSVTGGEEKKKI